uniref:EF-hand domain-containing protein n=1 Tax=Helicotheca tamesis TaxID=374047 RepID=A0A7S2E028_9STRA|mmetsp:Transcript_10718/g.14999  ORF Transcript_10718/g.14999 Transcript_10718/m.14999 type:complete len:407 (+) Transcript_10718:18-1238(+)
MTSTMLAALTLYGFHISEGCAFCPNIKSIKKINPPQVINCQRGNSLSRSQPTLQQNSFNLKFPSTSLEARNTNNEEESTSSSLITVNLGLVGQLALGQAIVGSTILFGGPGYQALIENASFGPLAILLGVAGSALLISFGSLVENSEAPQLAGINLSTNMVVLRLFGSKPQPVAAFFVSAFLGGLTGIVEEVTFRGQLLPTLSSWSSTMGMGDKGVIFGAALSTLIFALLHTNPNSLLKGGEASQDNLVLLVFQLITGIIFAILFLTTENLAVPIVAHALYDFWTFFKTHLNITSQIDYARKEVNMPSANFAGEAKWRSQRGEKFVQEAREMFYLMDTNQDGVLSRKELRVALYSYGMNLSKMGSAKVARVADMDRSGSIDFGEFLEFIGPSGSAGKAIKNSLLGI